MPNDVIYNIFISVISGVIIMKIDKWWKSAKTPITTKTNLSFAAIRKTRKQFFTSLFLLIACIIAFAKNYHPYLNFTAAVLAGLFIVILWGAFDAVYFPLEKIVKSHTTENTDKLNEEIN